MSVYIVVASLVITISLTEALKCYTCVSDNIPDGSREAIQQSINIPTYAASPDCNSLSPWLVDMKLSSVKVENCTTACIKIVSENKFLSIVMRGCLNRMYQSLQFPLNDNSWDSYPNVCNKQIQGEGSIAETEIHTCLCSDSLCNAGEKPSLTLFVLIIAACLSYLVQMNV